MVQSNGSTTLIAQGTEVSGDIEFSGELEVQGVVRGSIRARAGETARVRVVEHGVVEGEIHAPEVLVNGCVRGNIYAAEHAELAARAEVDGDVHYQLVEMVRGARINGRLVYDRPGEGAPVSVIGAVGAPDDKVD